MKNRLSLDFTLNGIDERQQFIQDYLKQDKFKKEPPTNEELEKIANYLLWGKESDGKSPAQKKFIQIQTKNKTWTKADTEGATQSLNELLENPNFDENLIQSINDVLPTKKKKEVFSRSEALDEAPPELIPEFQKLWARIDQTDLRISLYEELIGKRTKPIRPELLARFTPEEIEQEKEAAARLTQQAYLRLRHQLVQLRSTQYSLRDTYRNFIQKESRTHLRPIREFPLFEEDISVLPLGIFGEDQLSCLIFSTQDFFAEEEFSMKAAKKISAFLWEKKNSPTTSQFIDFRNEKHVYQLLLCADDIQREAEITTSPEHKDSLLGILRALTYYIENARLTDLQRDILFGKMTHIRNEDIRDNINKKYNHHYTVNYISTIFTKQVIREICAAATLHLAVLESFCFPENFKRCNCCGKLLLKVPYNFVRKTHSFDGFCNRCKVCDKAARQRNKEVKASGKDKEKC